MSEKLQYGSVGNWS